MNRHLHSQRLISCTVAAIPWLLGSGVPGWAAGPLLYRQPAYESPIRGDPDDLLLIAGYGFKADDRVVYRALTGNPRQLARPLSLPSRSTAALGIADVVSFADIPYSLTVRLPNAMRRRQAYALWVRTARGEWSEAVRINDARPYWVSPPFVYSSAKVASLPRYLKVVGRNLEPALGAKTEVRLSGPESVVLAAVPAPADSKALDQYVARVILPKRLRPGRYRVAVRRDATGWVKLDAQDLFVHPDPPVSKSFYVDDPRYGGCRANDDLDDRACILRAIDAAAAAGSGIVAFGPGTWILSANAVNDPGGIVVPRNVSLRGVGRDSTMIIRRSGTKSVAPTTAFTLMGGNEVEGITFQDLQVYDATQVSRGFVMLGRARRERPRSGDALDQAVRDIVITRDRFLRPDVAISDGGGSLTRILITYNEFDAYRSDVELAGNRYRVAVPFEVKDTIIAYNDFKPGSYLNVAVGQGVIASEIGASRRVDFSDNDANGAATDALYSFDDARGWRAAFFWHMNNNQEMLLVSDNTASCTGDKDGDGEAIAYDNNANTFALPRPEKVTAASDDGVSVAGPLAARQNDRDVPLDRYYIGHYVQVVAGPGLGQVRKIVAYRIDPGDGTVRLRVAPNWDVVPIAGATRISVGREFWQVYTVANKIDQRTPLCRKSNRTAPKGDGIVLWAQAADSAIEGNRQFDTSGITFQQKYNATERGCAVCNGVESLLDFIEIRRNLIDGEYDWDDDCSSSGIFGSLAAGPTVHSPPQTASFGVSISHNTIVRADGWRGGAISFVPTWYQGRPEHRWPLVDNALIYHNRIVGFDAQPARACHGERTHARTGISLGDSQLVTHTVLYANRCTGARRPVFIGATDTLKVCRAASPGSCECSPSVRRPLPLVGSQ